jgi:hypothetical protein
MRIKSWDLLWRGCKVIFATATPIRNTLGEAFVMQRYLQEPELAALPPFQWRFGRRGWDVLWLRPVVELRLHEATRMSVEADAPAHPGYAL